MTWVLIRGLTRETRHWGHFGELLSAHLAGEKVVAIDLPGNGVFFDSESPATVQTMVVFVRRKLQAQGHQGPFKLLAMSLGGMVAAQWSACHPAEVERMVLINTSMRPFSKLTQRLRPSSWYRLALLALDWGRPARAEKLERNVHELTCQNSANRDAVIASWLGIRRTAPVSTRNAMQQLLAAARFSFGSLAPDCPVLVLSSRGDQLVNPACSTALAAAWQASHQVHEKAGHDLPHDDAQWVCKQIVCWPE